MMIAGALATGVVMRASTLDAGRLALGIALMVMGICGIVATVFWMVAKPSREDGNPVVVLTVAMAFLIGAGAVCAMSSDPGDSDRIGMADKANTAALESHYDVNLLQAQRPSRESSIVPYIHDDGAAIPVTFMNDAGLVHGDVVIMGDRATLYVGSSAQRTEYKGESSTAGDGIESKAADNGSSGESGNESGHDKGSQSDAARKER